MIIILLLVIPLLVACEPARGPTPRINTVYLSCDDGFTGPLLPGKAHIHRFGNRIDFRDADNLVLGFYTPEPGVYCEIKYADMEVGNRVPGKL